MATTSKEYRGIVIRVATGKSDFKYWVRSPLKGIAFKCRSIAEAQQKIDDCLLTGHWPRYGG